MDYVVADLQLAMKKLYIDADAVLSSVQVDPDNERGEGRVQVKQLPDHVEYVEISQAVVLSMPMEIATTVIWNGMCAQSTQNDMYCIKVRGITKLQVFVLLTHFTACRCEWVAIQMDTRTTRWWWRTRSASTASRSTASRT